MMCSAQVAMLAAITPCFKMKVSKSILTMLVSSAFGAAGAGVAGRAAASLLKTIPCIGTIGGSAVAVTTGTVMTLALGEAYIALLTEMCRSGKGPEYLKTKEAKETFRNFVKEEKQKQDRKKGKQQESFSETEWEETWSELPEFQHQAEEAAEAFPISDRTPAPDDSSEPDPAPDDEPFDTMRVVIEED